MGEPEEDSVTETNGRVGFRDIYRAVGESEGRLAAQIGELGTRLLSTATDHETRIRVIEAAVTPIAVLSLERDKRLATVEAVADANAKAITNMTAREGGIFATLGAGKTLIIVGMGVMGTAIAVFDLVSKFAK